MYIMHACMWKQVMVVMMMMMVVVVAVAVMHPIKVRSSQLTSHPAVRQTTRPTHRQQANVLLADCLSVCLSVCLPALDQRRHSNKRCQKNTSLVICTTHYQLPPRHTTQHSTTQRRAHNDRRKQQSR